MSAKEQVLQKILDASDASGDVPHGERLAFGFGLSVGWDARDAQPSAAHEALVRMAPTLFLQHSRGYYSVCKCCVVAKQCGGREPGAFLLCTFPEAYAIACEGVIKHERAGEGGQDG